MPCWQARHTERVTDSLAHGQTAHRVRFDWGPTAAEHVTADVAVVVDVLSFTTTLSVAVELGIEVFPHPDYDLDAKKLAMRHGATLALRRFEALAHTDGRHVSLSPTSLAAADGIERLVLPSPNGSAISARYAEQGAVVIGGCLRNATAVGHHVADVLGDRGSVVVIAAGEQWPEGVLRPAAEDLWGAGAVLTALADVIGRDAFSPEARLAADAFAVTSPRLGEEMRACASGRELIEKGFPEDVEMAAAHDASKVVPHLVGASFVAATPTG
jgi:2-phosphosulfolactate phosphatase